MDDKKDVLVQKFQVTQWARKIKIYKILNPFTKVCIHSPSIMFIINTTLQSSPFPIGVTLEYQCICPSDQVSKQPLFTLKKYVYRETL